MEEQTIAIVSFQGALKREIVRMINRLKQDETFSYLSFDMKVTGRVDSDVKIEFNLYDDDGSHVKGNNIDTMVDEALRRRGYAKIHAPLMLTHSHG